MSRSSDAIARHARRQQHAVELRPAHGKALQLQQRLQQPLAGVARLPGLAADAVPVRQEAPECRGIHRRDLVARAGERAPAQAPHDLGVAPLGLSAERANLAVHQLAAGLQQLEHRRELRRRQAEALAELPRRERPMRAGVAADQLLQRRVCGAR
jgi:hypothetical protein